jgi:CHAT domain-containing protein/Tfp pilus assembly protein PilF
LLALVAGFAGMPLCGQQQGGARTPVAGESMPGEARTRIERLEEVLKEAQAQGDRKREAGALILIGETHLLTGDSKTSMEYFERVLPMVRSLGLKAGEATVLMDMGAASREANKEQLALEYANQALAEFREIGNRNGESLTLNNLAIVYYDLGENEKALEYYSSALKIFDELGKPVNSGMALNNLGRLYLEMGQPAKALDALNRAIAILQTTPARMVEGRADKNLGNVYRETGDTARAIETYEKALAIMKAIGDRSGQAMTLDDIGTLRLRQGQRRQALENYKEALAIATSANEPIQGALVYSHLMHFEQETSPALAIFYGKQSVNLLQQVRGEIHSLDKDLQKSFLTSKTDYYHDLAELLIAQGRLPEAQQVLDLLKQEEYTEYLRGEATDPMTPLSLSVAEQKAEEDYQQSTAQLERTQQQWAELNALPSRTPEQNAQLEKLSESLKASSNGLNQYFERLYKLFDTSTANDRLAAVKGNTAALDEVIGEMPLTVALYTSVTKNRYSVIVITGSGQEVGRKYDIAEKDLNEKIAAFQHVLRTPSSDPKPLAQELYKILIGPIQADLDQAKAKTLVWSLDGTLRYIPLAALHDGKHYLIENYNLVTFTPASIPYLQTKPNLANVSAVAMGISRKYQDGLNPLPAVEGELDDVIKDPNVQGANGVLPGTILMNDKFTERAMEDQLAARHSVVHIASHFVLQPGDEDQSYLLIAGKESESAGYHLTVADFRDNPNIKLRATELLTLSACETGVSSYASNGREVDGLATTAQLKGAKAVLSTLWSVNDLSTGALMADFYQRWAGSGSKLAKVEALRDAQLDLLLRRAKGNGGGGDRGLNTEDGKPSAAPSDYSHPFYWAPFVLAGNWQ